VNAVFADTAYFSALLNARDSLHSQAKAHVTQPPGLIVTTAWVLVEVGDALSTPPVRERFTALVRTLKMQANATIIQASHELFDRG